MADPVITPISNPPKFNKPLPVPAVANVTDPVISKEPVVKIILLLLDFQYISPPPPPLLAVISI